MNLAAVMDEVAAAAAEISGLRMTAWPPGSVQPPAGAVSYPESIAYDQTYGRGMSKINGLPLILVSGKAIERTARDAVSTWTATHGEGSVRQHLERRPWACCDDLSVVEARFDVVSIAGVEYLAAMFSLDIVGSDS